MKPLQFSIYISVLGIALWLMEQLHATAIHNNSVELAGCVF